MTFWEAASVAQYDQADGEPFRTGNLSLRGLPQGKRIFIPPSRIASR